MDEDEIIKSCTRLLEKGCTMLATHHDCGAPLFRCQGEVVCPVCSFLPDETAVSRSNDSGNDSGGSSSENQSPVLEETVGEGQEETRSVPADKYVRPGIGLKVEWMLAEEHLEGSLLRKLKELTRDLEKEQDLSEMKRQLDCLDGLMRVFHSLYR